MKIGFICGLGKNVSQLKYVLVGHIVRTLRTPSSLLTDQESDRDGLKLSPKFLGDLLVYLYLCAIIANEVMTEQEIFKKEALKHPPVAPQDSFASIPLSRTEPLCHQDHCRT